MGPKTVFIDGFVLEKKDNIVLSGGLDQVPLGKIKVNHANFCAISAINAQHLLWFELTKEVVMFLLFPGSVWNSNCLEGVVINSSTAHEAKHLKKGYPLYFLPSGGCQSKQNKQLGSNFIIS